MGRASLPSSGVRPGYAGCCCGSNTRHKTHLLPAQYNESSSGGGPGPHPLLLVHRAWRCRRPASTALFLFLADYGIMELRNYGVVTPNVRPLGTISGSHFSLFGQKA